MRTFIKKGFSLTTLEDIAAEGNVTRGAIYHHFKGKNDIYDLLVENADKNLMNILEKKLNQDISPLFMVKELLHSVVNNFYSNKQFRYFIELTWFKRETDLTENSSIKKKEMTEYFHRMVKRLLRQAKSNGSLKVNTGINTISIQIICLISGFYRGYFINPEYFRDKSKTIKLFDSFYNSIINSDNLK